MQNFGYILLFPSIFILLCLEKWSKIAYYTNESHYLPFFANIFSIDLQMGVLFEGGYYYYLHFINFDMKTPMYNFLLTNTKMMQL